MRLIGLTGYAGSGKDEIAKILVREHGFQRVAFADPLREMLYALNPVIDHYDGTDEPFRLQTAVDSLGWDRAKRNYSEIRCLLQRLGTEAGRNVLGDHVWINLAMQRAREARGAVVITDVRFHNEAAAALAHGGVLWRVERPGIVAVNGHISDTNVAGIAVDRTITNDGNLADLAQAVYGALTCVSS